MKIYTYDQIKNGLTRPSVRDNREIAQKTAVIIEQVKQNGDAALRQLSKKFDNVVLDDFKINTSTFNDEKISAHAKQAIDIAYNNIYAFHHAQLHPKIKIESTPGVVCEKITRPIQRVGLYIPGGSAPLISTTLMLGVPAQIADNPHRILCTPPNKNGEIDPHIIYVAKKCGINIIYKLGGAQAIAAMAYGTDTVTKVDKIFGPGNAYVTAAKQFVANDPKGASIDLPAGPSEVLVIADDDANATYVAADLLSQAEHGPDSQAILLCLSKTFAEKVSEEVKQLLVELPRKEIAAQSIAHSAIIIVNDLNQAIHISNQYAPEHLIIQTQNARDLLPQITCAGSIFLGNYSPESAGDYASGTNHVLPTYGYARSYSGLNTNDFLLHISVQELTQQGLKTIGPHIETLAELEGLNAHALAVSIRLKDIL
ncbi:MAG: histidinol dehydrogenase [Gammaproteobacteria bacterium]|jgi:histidinol dehydrogenase